MVCCTPGCCLQRCCRSFRSLLACFHAAAVSPDPSAGDEAYFRAACCSLLLTCCELQPRRLAVLQVWLGRAAMALFALLLAYETMHSNRPAFGTLFYLWF